MRKISAMKIIADTARTISKAAPVATTMVVLQYIKDAILPATIALISVNLFESAANFISGGEAGNIFLYGIMYLVTYLIGDVMECLFNVAINAGVYEKGTAAFRVKLYDKSSRLSFISFEDPEILNKKERAEKTITSEILPSLFNNALFIPSQFIAVVGVMTVLAQYSLWLLPLSLMSVVPYFIARLIRGKEFFYVKHNQAKQTRKLKYLWDLFNNKQTAKEMRTMGFDGYVTEQWKKTRDEVNEELWELDLKDARSMLFCDGIRILGYGVSIMLVLWMVISGDISIGVFGACLSAFTTVQNGTKTVLSQGAGRMPEWMAYARDYYEFLGIDEDVDGARGFDGFQNVINVKNVSFAYPNCDKFALENIDITINKGEKIAILGENGSGKTTLSKLVLGMYEPTLGTVTYDDIDVKTFRKPELYSKVSLIQQNFVPYSLTVRENVAISKNDELDNDEKIVKTLRDAGLENLVDIGLDTQLGREFGGTDLSGGQWQKLAIARGMYRDSELIILDEPTSALDPIVETEVLTDFINASAGKTAVIISHRVGLCKLVDKIIVMKNGRVAECGSHNELLAKDGEYAALYSAQSRWYN